MPAPTSAPTPAQAAPATATPQFAPTQPVVQSTPSVEERLNAAVAASEAEAESAAPAPAKKAASKPAAQSVSRAAATPASAPRAAEPAPVTEPATQTAPVAPITPPVEAAAVTEAAPPVAAQEAPAESAPVDPALLWALGGGALLLLGLGGTALLRRRRKQDQWADADEGAPVEPVRVAPAPMPLMTPTPAVRTQSSLLVRVQENAPLSADQTRLEAMIAAPPSPENPFRTHSKRATRAKFLLAQQQAARETPAAAAAMEAPSRTESPRPAPAAPQTVYRFGADRRRDSLLKPRTS